jgi:hypothetical protein
LFDAVAINTISSNGFLYFNVPTGYTHTFQSNGVNALQVSTGDILFYEATGTTPKFFWDASAEALGLGTTSPASKIHVQRSDDGTIATFRGTSSAQLLLGIASGNLVYDSSNGNATHVFQSNTTERARIDSSGNLGIGTSSPGARLEVAGETRIYPSSGSAVIRFGSGGVEKGKIDVLSTSNMLFETAGTERMRIDSSGNVGIGTSSPSARFQANTTINTVYSSSDTLTSGVIAYIRNDSSTNATAATLRLDALGSANVAAASISAVHTGDGASALTFGTRTNGGSDVTERMRIDSSGNLGIGGTVNLSAAQSTDGQIRISNTTTRASGNKYGIRFADSTFETNAAIYAEQGGSGNNASALVFGTNGGTGGAVLTSATERARINGDGDLLVGTTSWATGQNAFRVNNFGRVDITRNLTAAADQIYFANPNGVVGAITTTGSATAYNTSSDYRLKEDWQPVSGASERLMDLKPVNFAWKVDGSRVDGFLAHEAQEVVPEAVTGEKDGEEMQAIDHSKLVPLLTAALQEALTKIEALEARLNALEGQ